MTTCYSDHMYLVAGDHQSSMITMCYWLVAAGARNIVIICRHGLTHETRLLLTKMLLNGVRVMHSNVDITKLKETVNIIKACSHYGPVGGIIYVPFTRWDSIMLKVNLWDKDEFE